MQTHIRNNGGHARGYTTNPRGERPDLRILGRAIRYV